ncbi:MAG: MotE family protein [Pseudooceanicola sp.]
MIRPGPLILLGLAGATAAKITLSLVAGADLQEPVFPRDSLFLAAADAAGAPKEEPAPEPAVMAEPQQCEETPEEMLRSIKRERQLLAEQKQKLSQREAEVELASETVELERARLGELKAEVESLLDRVKQAHTADVDRLVALYRNMKPKDAAGIMNDLDIEVTVMVLGTMAERDAAPIMAALNPVKARTVSQIILERSKLPGDQRLDNIKW